MRVAQIIDPHPWKVRRQNCRPILTHSFCIPRAVCLRSVVGCVIQPTLSRRVTAAMVRGSATFFAFLAALHKMTERPFARTATGPALDGFRAMPYKGAYVLALRIVWPTRQHAAGGDAERVPRRPADRGIRRAAPLRGSPVLSEEQGGAKLRRDIDDTLVRLSYL